MESSRRDLFIDMIVDRFLSKNNQITSSPSFTFTPKTRTGLPKTGVSFYCLLFVPLNRKRKKKILWQLYGM